MLEVIDHAGLGVLMQSKEGIDYDTYGGEKKMLLIIFKRDSSQSRIACLH